MIPPCTSVFNTHSQHSNKSSLLEWEGSSYLRLANSDAMMLENLLAKNLNRSTVFNESNLDRKRQNQIERNRSAMANFEQIMLERQQQVASEEAAQFFVNFTSIVDAERPIGQKLFTNSEIEK